MVRKKTKNKRIKIFERDRIENVLIKKEFKGLKVRTKKL